MTKDKALKMAIEAFARFKDDSLDDKTYFQMCKDASFACHKALEQQEIGDAEIKKMLDDIEWYQQEQRKLIDRIKALEQPAQEPVAWRNPNDDDRRHAFMWHGKPRDKSKYTIPLYTHPHQWQGLTDDERKELSHNNKCWMNAGGNLMFDWEYFARAIEQALKEKNHG